jgi:hypothetical protein
MASRKLLVTAVVVNLPLGGANAAPAGAGRPTSQEMQAEQDLDRFSGDIAVIPGPVEAIKELDASRETRVLTATEYAARTRAADGTVEIRRAWLDEYRQVIAVQTHGGYLRPTGAELEDEQIKNYVIELATGNILGETGGHHFGTRTRSPEGLEDATFPVDAVTKWAANSRCFLQTTYRQGAATGCWAGAMTEAGKRQGMAEIRGPAAVTARARVEQRKPSQEAAARVASFPLEDGLKISDAGRISLKVATVVQREDQRELE